MPTIVEQLLARCGKTIADLPRQTTLGKVVRRKGVAGSPELERIKDIHRRRWEQDPDLPQLIQLLTEEYKTPGGAQTLRPVQAQSLRELYELGGLLGPIPVGEGKTLISLLAPAVLEAKRPVLLLPAKLIEKTEGEIRALRHHWRIPTNIRLVSVELLGSPKAGPELLDKYLPDLIVCDEAHRFKNLRAARTRRLKRYLEAHPDCVYVALSGTIMDSSLRDYHHLQAWALPEPLQPLPRTWAELQDWADALDENVAKRLAPGALLDLCEPGERNDLAGVRRAFGRRLVETPGVIVVNGSGVHCSLSVEGDLFDGYSPETDEAFATLAKWVTPDGWELTDSLSKWAHEYQMALGFYYRWNPRPPKAWMQARQDWSRFCRDIVQHNRRNLDTEFHVVRAIDQGLYDNKLLETWRAVRPTFTPNVESVWVDGAVLEHVAQWLDRERGIVWVNHTEFGEALSELTGAPYFGAQGLDAKGRSIEVCKGGPIIASIKANSEGRNLQDRWSSNYITAPPGTAKEWEQLIGRTHRPGQKADEVACTVLFGCLAQYSALIRAKARSQFVKDSSTQDRKLLLADWLVPTITEVSQMRGPRWARKD